MYPSHVRFIPAAPYDWAVEAEEAADIPTHQHLDDHEDPTTVLVAGQHVTVHHGAVTSPIDIGDD